jgi:hypothetical protein
MIHLRGNCVSNNQEWCYQKRDEIFHLSLEKKMFMLCKRSSLSFDIIAELIHCIKKLNLGFFHYRKKIIRICFYMLRLPTKKKLTGNCNSSRRIFFFINTEWKENISSVKHNFIYHLLFLIFSLFL